MGHIHTFVKNCNDYRRIAIASELRPCLFNLNISILDKLGRTEVSVIDKMPLIGKQRVIECGRRGLRRQLTQLLCSQRHSLAFADPLQCTVELHLAHLAESRKILSHLRDRTILIETDYIPQMKSLFASL